MRIGPLGLSYEDVTRKALAAQCRTLHSCRTRCEFTAQLRSAPAERPSTLAFALLPQGDSGERGKDKNCANDHAERKCHRVLLGPTRYHSLHGRKACMEPILYRAAMILKLTSRPT